jgi:hypothetical protein
MPSTVADVLTDEDAVRAQIESIAEQQNVFRQAFREVDLSDANADTVYFVVYNDVAEDVEIVPEGAEFPRKGSPSRRVPCVRNKYGEEYGITKEDLMDEIFDNLSEEADSKMRRMANRMDSAAFETLSNNLSPEGPFTPTDGSDGTLSYSDIVDANAALETGVADQPNSTYAPDTIFVGAQGKADLLKDEHFTHATEAGDETIREGRIGSVIGIGDVYVSTSSSLGEGEAILVDSARYGREGVWQAPDVREYKEEKTQTETVMQMDSFMGWAATQPSAGMKVEG